VKRALAILLLLGVSSLAAFAQSNNQQAEPTQQQTGADAARLKAQRRYDPPGGRKHIIRGGPLEGLLDSINQQDIDYGAKLADARQIFLGVTVENLYFWIMVGEGATVVILVLYVFWLFRERGNRLEISVNIVTQLANSYLYTRARAVDAIRRHNQLVDEYNAMAEKLARQDATEQKVMTSVVRSSDGNQAIEIPSQTATPLSLPESAPNSKPNSSEDSTAATSATPAEVSMTKGQLKKLVEDAKRDATLGAKHQVSALTQQVRNLREQLNQALTQIQTMEKQNRTSVGA
jgi:hypothetical protein